MMLLAFNDGPSTVKSVEKSVMFNSNLFLFCFCTLCFHSLSLSSLPVVFGPSTIEGGTKKRG